jgi:hypothetical protein
MAAELRAMRFPKAELVLVLPERDAHPRIREAARDVRASGDAGDAVTIRTVADDWHAQE